MNTKPPDLPTGVVHAAFGVTVAVMGASGVVASREYEEMQVENLKAFGRAVRDATKPG